MGPLPPTVEGAAQARGCANQAQDHAREIDDLTQQTRAAEAVERANWLGEANFWLTRIQLILSALGAVALIYSLYLNRQATALNRQATALNRQATALNRQATALNRQATEASLKGEEAALAAVAEARRSNDLAQAANAVDQRPWLHVEVEALTDASVDTLPGQKRLGRRHFGASAQMRIINTGKTPARDVFVHIAALNRKDTAAALSPGEFHPGKQGYRVVGVVPPNSVLAMDFPLVRSFEDMPDQQDFEFKADLLCDLRYYVERASSGGSARMTIQVFHIENNNGRKLSTWIDTTDIRDGRVKLSVRPAVGAMT